MTFKDYFSVVDTRSRCYFSFEDEEDQYFDHGYIHIYGIPDNLSDDEESSIYNGGSDRTVYLGEIKGSLILGNQMSDDGEDILTLCDDMSADLLYVATSLASDGLIDPYTGIYSDIYYIYELEMQKGYDDKELKQTILEKLPYILFSLYHVKPEYLAYYPLPLGSSNEDALVPKHSVSLFTPKITEEGIEAIQADILVNDDQLDTLSNHRATYSPYPASEKDRELWELYASCGFREAGKTRMLYKTVN